MKTEVRINSPKPSMKFPLLVEERLSKTIILFTSEYTGMILVQKDNGYKAGEYREDFSSVFYDDIWEILPPGSEIVLIQE